MSTLSPINDITRPGSVEDVIQVIKTIMEEVARGQGW